MTALFFFIYFATATLISSIFTIGLRNPVQCTIALLSALLHTAGLFILMNAEFIAAMQIIIYAGAVLVLYLFVLMLLDLKNDEVILHKQSRLALFFSAVLLGEVLLALFKAPLLEEGQGHPHGGNNVHLLGVSLFTDYLLQFEVVGILLLGGIVGAFVLAKQKSVN